MIQAFNIHPNLAAKHEDRIAKVMRQGEVDQRPMTEQVMDYLERNPGTSNMQLAKALKVTPTQVSPYLMSLFERGYLTRQRIGTGRLRYAYSIAEQSE